MSEFRFDRCVPDSQLILDSGPTNLYYALVLMCKMFVCALSFNIWKFSCAFTTVKRWKVQQNSIYLTHVAPNRCQIIKYSGLSVGTYTDQSSYR